MGFKITVPRAVGLVKCLAVEVDRAGLVSMLAGFDEIEVVDGNGSCDPRAFAEFVGVNVSWRNTPRARAEIRDAILVIDAASRDWMRPRKDVVIVFKYSSDAIFFKERAPFTLDIRGVRFGARAPCWPVVAGKKIRDVLSGFERLI